MVPRACDVLPPGLYCSTRSSAGSKCDGGAAQPSGQWACAMLAPSTYCMRHPSVQATLTHRRLWQPSAQWHYQAAGSRSSNSWLRRCKQFSQWLVVSFNICHVPFVFSAWKKNSHVLNMKTTFFCSNQFLVCICSCIELLLASQLQL